MLESNTSPYTESHSSSHEESLELVQQIGQVIYEKLGKNIFTIDITNLSTLCDYCIIAEGTVDRHVKAIASTIERDLKEKGHKAVRVDGHQDGNWVIIDYLNVMVHILTPDFREKYSLERLWQEGTILDLNFEHEL